VRCLHEDAATSRLAGVGREETLWAMRVRFALAMALAAACGCGPEALHRGRLRDGAVAIGGDGGGGSPGGDDAGPGGGDGGIGGEGGSGGEAGEGEADAGADDGGASGCAGTEPWKAGVYKGGAVVTSGDPPHRYQCKPFPFEGWCGNVGYEPGKPGAPWMDAWVDLGPCP
jgi:hypothetical protein